MHSFRVGKGFLTFLWLGSRQCRWYRLGAGDGVGEQHGGDDPWSPIAGPSPTTVGGEYAKLGAVAPPRHPDLSLSPIMHPPALIGCEFSMLGGW